jgi:cytochrome P450
MASSLTERGAGSQPCAGMAAREIGAATARSGEAQRTPVARRVPAPGWLEQLWSLLRFRVTGDKLAIIDALTKRYGPTVRVASYYLLVGPDANQLLVASPPGSVRTYANSTFPTLASMDGAEHLRHRRLVSAAFRRDALQVQLPALLEVYARRSRSWTGRIDLYSEMNVLVLDVLLEMFLGIRFGTAEYGRFVAAYWPLIERADPFSWLPSRKKAVARAKREMWALLHELVARRQRQPQPDALSAIIAAASKDSHPERLTNEDLVRYGYMLLDFGQGDIAIYLTYAIAIAASLSRCRAALCAEAEGTSLDDVLDLEKKMPFTFAYLLEVERLYTPVADIHRTVAKELTFRECRIPAGATVVSSLFHTQRLPQLFREPLSFNPDRFRPPRNEHEQHPFSVMGFGAGRHMCVAATLSRCVGALVLARVLRDFRVELAEHQLPEIDYRRALQMPKRRLHVRFVPA